jgi:hypothetical protein
MNPLISSSIIKFNEKCFKVGSSMICEEIQGAAPPAALATWQDDGRTFIIRKDTERDRRMQPSSSPAKKLAERGTSWAIWLFGELTFCLVSSWTEGQPLGADNIAFVKEHCPSIPVPEVIYSFVDHAWSRSFFFYRRPPGDFLTGAWSDLSSERRKGIAEKVARYCKELSLITSPVFSAPNMKGVLDYHLNVKPEPSHPSWRDRPIGPLTLPDFTTFLKDRIGGTDFVPDIGNTFHCYHGSLAADSILVSDSDEITGILDWEFLAFYPKFYIALKPEISFAFRLGQYGGNNQWEWSTLLQNALIAEGFPYSSDVGDWYLGLSRKRR